ncbi:MULTISPECIES: DUF421 domain-containing protein [unclassified Deinococcus]|uniref:DUF421 domain-containing protein n=1 Tax=unclassified Deinococcus TaxID=2623546 RepID=UPI001C2FF89B|nr:MULTISPECIES: DUF421 domain-containing protein [unclassified Deinococcus]MDK2012520.1 DUF421 domain-containing protein [Deinococcus sp. 43]
MSAEVVPFDWARIFLGDTPPLFLLEIIFRTTVIFGWLLLLLRFTGKRGLAQLSPLELAIVIGLGSAAGDPMFYPEVPLLHAMLVLAVVVSLQTLLARLVIRSERVETFVEGVPVELVRDGVLSGRALEVSNLSREDLFERLRAQGVRQLGEVQRAYFEQDGNLTVFTHAQHAPPGLPVVPPWDLEPPRVVQRGEPVRGPLACLGCGTTRDPSGQQDAGTLSPCGCGSDRFTPATTDPLTPPTTASGAGGDADDRAPGQDGGGRGPLAGLGPD